MTKKKSKTTDPPFVIVSWLDAWGNKIEEVPLEAAIDSHRATPMETAGWLLHQDDKGVSVCNERYAERKDPYRGRTFIPRSMIVEVQIYRLAKVKNGSTTARNAKPTEPGADSANDSPGRDTIESSRFAPDGPGRPPTA